MRGQRLVLTDQTRRGGSQSHRGPGSPETRCHDLRSAEENSVKINSSACQFTFGGCFGSTMTRRSPYLLSVLNIGASVLTSHLSRMLSRWVSRIMSRTCNAQWRPRSGWRGGVRSRYSALCLYWLRAWEKSNVIIQSKGLLCKCTWFGYLAKTAIAGLLEGIKRKISSPPLYHLTLYTWSPCSYGTLTI